MGLDMYLTKHTYIGAEFDHRKIEGTIALTQDGKPIPINLKKVSYIIESVGYWRKANQIHAWFVEYVQNGEDDCKEHRVFWLQLKELKNLCKKALETKDATILAPKAGFFFGSIDIDEWYWLQLEDTIKIIERLDPDGSYYYQSSW